MGEGWVNGWMERIDRWMDGGGWMGEGWVSEGLPLLFQDVSMSFSPLLAMSSSRNYSLLEEKKKIL